MKAPTSKKLTDIFLVRLSIVGPIIISILIAIWAFCHGLDFEAIYKFLRVTGRIMLATFLISFGASTSYYFFPNKATHTVLKFRKYFGISFAVFMFCHLIGLYLKFYHDTPFFMKTQTMYEYVFGGIAIIFTGIMGFTSTDRAQKFLGHKNWKRLHTICGNYLLISFWRTYLDHELQEFPMFFLVNCLIILRSLRRIQILKRTKKMNLAGIILILIGALAAALITLNLLEIKKNMSGYAGLVFLAKDYYPLNEGARWVYRTDDSTQDSFTQEFEIRGREEVSGRETWRLYFSDEGYKCLAYDPSGLSLYKEFDKGQSEIHNPPTNLLPDLRLNVTSRSYSNFDRLNRASNQSVVIKGETEFRILNLENITVAAGVFKDCLKVEFYEKWTSPDGSYDISAGVKWFAKKVGVVREETRFKTYDSPSGKFTSHNKNSQLVSFNNAAVIHK